MLRLLETGGDWISIIDQEKMETEASLNECIKQASLSYARRSAHSILRGSGDISYSTSMGAAAKVISGWCLKDVLVMKIYNP